MLANLTLLLTSSSVSNGEIQTTGPEKNISRRSFQFEVTFLNLSERHNLNMCQMFFKLTNGILMFIWVDDC